MAVNLDYPPGATPLDADEFASLIPGHLTTQEELTLKPQFIHEMH